MDRPAGPAQARRSGLAGGRGACLALVIGLASPAIMALDRGFGSQNGTPSAPRPAAELRFADLKPDAILAIEFESGATASPDAIWVPQRAANAIVGVDAKTNAVGNRITLAKPPCASLSVAFDTVWVPQCDSGTLLRVDPKSGNVSPPLPLRVAQPLGSIATAGASMWLATDAKGVVSRIDPSSNAAVAEAYVAAKPFAVAADGNAVWVTSDESNLLTRIDAHTNVIVETVKIAGHPGRMAIGEGAVWTLNRGDGSVSRVDLKTNKVVATISVGAAVVDGELAAGEGSVWISARGLPIVRIDPRTNRVAQRFTGDGGGAILVAHGSLWVSAGPKATWRIDPKLVAAMRP